MKSFIFLFLVIVGVLGIYLWGRVIKALGPEPEEMTLRQIFDTLWHNSKVRRWLLSAIVVWLVGCVLSFLLVLHAGHTVKEEIVGMIFFFDVMTPAWACAIMSGLNQKQSEK